MAFREKAKLALLAGLFLVCLGSIATSQKSFQMGTRDLPLLQPQVRKFCEAIFKARKTNNCRKGQQSDVVAGTDTTTSSNNCQEILQQASSCETAVTQAYRTINMGGCPHEMRDVTLCELERCGGYHGISVVHNHLPTSRAMDATMGCVHHCDAFKKTLETCVTKHVQHELKQYGLLKE